MFTILFKVFLEDMKHICFTFSQLWLFVKLTDFGYKDIHYDLNNLTFMLKSVKV